MESFGTKFTHQSGYASTSIDHTFRSSRDELDPNTVQLLKLQLHSANKTIAKLQAENTQLKANLPKHPQPTQLAKLTQQILNTAQVNRQVQQLLQKHFNGPSSFQEQVLATDGLMKVLRFSKELIRNLPGSSSLERLSRLNSDLQATISRSNLLLASPKRPFNAYKPNKPTVIPSQTEPKVKHHTRVSIKKTSKRK